jgi:hypothetical protein
VTSKKYKSDFRRPHVQVARYKAWLSPPVCCVSVASIDSLSYLSLVGYLYTATLAVARPRTHGTTGGATLSIDETSGASGMTNRANIVPKKKTIWRPNKRSSKLGVWL